MELNELMPQIQFRIILWTNFWNKNHSHPTHCPQCYSELHLWQLVQLHPLFWKSLLRSKIALSPAIYFHLMQLNSAYRCVVRPGECAQLKHIWGNISWFICLMHHLRPLTDAEDFSKYILATTHRGTRSLVFESASCYKGFQRRVTGCWEEWPDADFWGEARWIYYYRFSTR